MFLIIFTPSVVRFRADGSLDRTMQFTDRRLNGPEEVASVQNQLKWEHFGRMLLLLLLVATERDVPDAATRSLETGKVPFILFALINKCFRKYHNKYGAVVLLLRYHHTERFLVWLQTLVLLVVMP